MLRLSAAVCLLFAAISPVLAQPAPPAEAVAACAGKTVGTAVTFTGPRGDLVAATCRERNGRLAAAPDVPPPE